MPGGARAAVAEAAYDAVKARAPSGAEVLPIGDGTDLRGVDFLVPRAGDRSILAVLPDLRQLKVVQVLSAGTDWIQGQLPPGVTLCSARGARDAPVTEWVLGALLGTSSGLLKSARVRRWERHPLSDLSRGRVLIVGLGSIGAMVQQRLEALGCQVIGVGSHARDGVHSVEELPDLVADCEAIVVLTPLTEATRGLIDGPLLAAMRDGTLIVNAARGPVVDTDALLAETRTGRLGAVLDVTDPEPLPEDHPLWDAPGVLAITPHIAGDSDLGAARAAELAGEQFARWCAGQPLRNVVAGAG